MPSLTSTVMSMSPRRDHYRGLGSARCPDEQLRRRRDAEGRDGLSGPGAGPAPFTRLPAADEGDDEDDDEARRRYLVADLAGNVRPLVIKVERDEDGEELTAKLEGDGVNKLTIELDDDELEQKIELGKGKDNETVRASYDGTRTRITVGRGGTKTTVTKPGLVLLRLVAGDGPLRVEY